MKYIKTLKIYLNRLREHLWFRPLIFCLFSIFGALLAHLADGTGTNDLVPSIHKESIKSLLNTISASMLVISIFAVASMLSAFSAASSTATPRSFKIVITDDVSKNALSVFIGAFIFSIVASIALDNGYYDKTGRFTLFLFTLILFAVVILTFLRWVDRISRLGRLEHTINQIEEVVTKSLSNYIRSPNMKALPVEGQFNKSQDVLSATIGYVQHINLRALQLLAKKKDLRIRLNCIPGNFAHQNSIIAMFSPHQDAEEITNEIRNSIIIGDT